MTSWNKKIGAAAAVGRRSSIEILHRLWNGNPNAPRPHTTSLSHEEEGSRRSQKRPGAVMFGTQSQDTESMSGSPITDLVARGVPPGTNVRQDCYHDYCSRPTNGNANSLLLSQAALKPVVIIPMSRVAAGHNGPPEDRGDSKLWKSHGNHSMGLVVSALYAKLLVVMGIAFPLSEVMSTYIPAAYYDGFYLYLYFGSISFMIWVFGSMLRERARLSARVLVRGMHSFRSRKNATDIETVVEGTTTTTPLGTESLAQSEKSSTSDGDFSDGSSTESPQTMTDERNDFMDNQESIPNGNTEHGQGYLHQHQHHRRHKGTHFGSFYLRMGCVAFGVGSMIYSGLEFGQYFELKSDTKCQNYMQALTPSVRMIFTFMQMYFIFLSSRMAVFKESLSSQFGLMHMIGTNLCVWLNVLVQETKHEILHFYDPDNQTISFKSVRAHQQFSGSYSNHGSGGIGNGHELFFDTSNETQLFPDIYDDYTTASPLTSDNHHEVQHRVTRGLKGPYSIHECGRTNIIGSIVQDAAPFLFPCTIEYSLICAAVCYVMWKSMAKRKAEKIVHKHSFRRSHSKTYVLHRNAKSPHHYTVDCAASHKGLFVGIFVLVLTIMSLIINFVLVKHPEYRDIANLEAHITEIVLYTMATCAVIIGMCQIRALRYSRGRNLELDNILLIVAQTGSLIFNIFAIISGQFILIKDKGENLVLVTALLKVIQLLLQTLFILDASKRVAATKDQVKKKPGREVVTFLLITNLSMWMINTLEKSKGESHPAQLQFYGVWAWTIITHISMPLAIFYRFHSTVCLCEIWKRAYKIKHLGA